MSYLVAVLSVPHTTTACVVLYNGPYIPTRRSPSAKTHILCSARFISPYIGSLSDKYGRKRVLLITMIGNLLSAVV